MLGKLLKYDIKNIGRLTGIECVILVVLSIIHLIAKQFYDHFSYKTAAYRFYSETRVALYAGMAIACVMFITLIVQYFFNNLFKDEGYLMHTLPVSAGSLMASKIVAALFCSVVMMSVCYLCEAAVSKNLFWAGRLISSFYGKKGWEVFVAAVLLYGIVYYINVLCSVFMGAGIGYGFTGKYQGVCVFFVCILAYVINQVLSLFAVWFVSEEFLEVMDQDAVSLGIAGKAVLAWSVVHLILAGVYSYVAVKRMKTHLNLD